jgi:predicted dinucleotide-binding enzyme
MKVCMLGTGVVGQTLAAGLAAHGYSVMVGTRDPSQQKVQDWVKATGLGITAGTCAEAAAFGEIAVLATAWDGVENVLSLADPRSFEGKVVIDVTNPLAHGPSGPELALGWNDSGGERVQKLLPGARVVKAWNIVTAKTMIDPVREEGVPDMLIAGNDANAKAAVTKILQEFGWPVIDLGGIEESRLLEPFAMLWVRYGILNKTWSHAFKLLKK